MYISQSKVNVSYITQFPILNFQKFPETSFISDFFFFIVDFSEFVERFCGTDGPGTRYSSGQYWTLHFVTDGSREYRGFSFYASDLSKIIVPNEAITWL